MAAHPNHPRGSTRKPKRVPADRRRVEALEEAVEQLKEAAE
jgi:hypothetical protein